MVRFIMRLLATLALAGAVAAAVIDGAKSLAAEALRLTPVGSTLLYAFPKPLTPFFRSLAAPGADTLHQAMLWLLSTPTEAVLTLGAMALYFLSRVRESPFDRMMAGR